MQWKKLEVKTNLLQLTLMIIFIPEQNAIIAPISNMLLSFYVKLTELVSMFNNNFSEREVSFYIVKELVQPSYNVKE